MVLKPQIIQFILSISVAIAADIDFSMAASNSMGGSKLEQDLIAPQVKIPLIFKLKNKVIISNKRIWLNEVATCEGYSAACDQIYGIDLGVSPDPGEIWEMTSENLKDILISELEGYEISGSGADRCLIETAAKKISEQEVFSAIRSKLQDLELPSKVRIIVEQVRLYKQITVLPEDFELSFPELDRGRFLSTDWLALNLSRTRKLRVIYKGLKTGVVFSAHVRIKMRAEIQATVAIKNIERGGFLDPQFFAPAWLKLVSSYSTWAVDIDKYRGYYIKSAISVGKPLKKSQVRPPNLVKRGEIINLKMVIGDLKLEGKAKALSNGSMGDKVTVLYLPTKKTILGHVVGDKQVEGRL